MSLSHPQYNGEDDYLPDSALDLIDALWMKLKGFEVGHMQGATRSITVTISFDDTHGPFAQCEALETALKATTVIGTLARNLRREREDAIFRRREIKALRELIAEQEKYMVMQEQFCSQPGDHHPINEARSRLAALEESCMDDEEIASTSSVTPEPDQ